MLKFPFNMMPRFAVVAIFLIVGLPLHIFFGLCKGISDGWNSFYSELLELTE